MTERNEMLAQAVQDVLERRNLTPHAAHLRVGISREAMNKLTIGRPTRIEIIEKFARALGLDVNQWRQLAGYDPIEDPRPPADRIREAADELIYDPNLEDLAIAPYDGGDLAPEDQERIRKIAAALRRQQRRLAE